VTMNEREKEVRTSQPKLITRRALFSKVLLPLTILAVGPSCNRQEPQQLLSTTSNLAGSGELEIPSPLTSHRRPLPKRINGINFPSWRSGEYQSQSAQQSLQNVTEISPNLIGVGPVLYQDTIASTEIGSTDNTVTDTDLRFIIDRIHQLGYSVMLAPHINLSQDTDPNHWHGLIGKTFTETQWQDWFSSYRQMIYHYSDLSEQAGVELFVAGNEYYIAALNRANDWRTTVSGIRSRYSGPLTYAAHIYSFDTITWWQELDLLGINPYFPLTNKNNPTLDELKASWRRIATKIEATANRWQKKVVFPEVGYPSLDGANQEPWNYRLISNPNIPVDVEEQANCIRAAYSALWSKSWWQGVVWWFWDTNPSIGGLQDKNYTPRGKPAANVIQSYSQTS
jgi:hypothetical protein